jgi:hypothetical protein
MTNNLVWTREGKLIAAGCWLAVGAIGLIANFHLVPPDWLEQSWKLWPLIPIAMGIGALLTTDRRGGWMARQHD